MPRMALFALLLILLSGCTGSGSGLSKYLMRPAEAMDDCRLLDMDSGDGRDISEFTGMTTNPGSMNNSFFEEDGIMPLENRVVLYECDDVQLFSAAQRFASPEDATTWVSMRIRCDEAPTFQDGSVVGAIESFDGDWTAEALAAAQAAEQRISRATGAIDVCPEA